MRLYNIITYGSGVTAALLLSIVITTAGRLPREAYGLFVAAVLAAVVVAACGWLIKAGVKAVLADVLPEIGHAVADAAVVELESRIAAMLERNHARTMAGVREVVGSEVQDVVDAAVTRARVYGQVTERQLRAAAGHGTPPPAGGGQVTQLRGRPEARAD